MKYSFLYVASVVMVNAMFAYVPAIDFYGNMWSVGSIVAGCVFVLRDFSQKEVGHKVIFLMIAAAILSYITSGAFVATASILAFAVAEIIDWAVFSIPKTTFKNKIIFSSLVSVPVDTAIFLYVIDYLSVAGFAVMTISKLIAVAYVVWRLK